MLSDWRDHYADPMADQTRAEIDIAAASDEVMAVIEDFDAYPEWVDNLESATVEETGDDGRPRLVRMVLNHPVIKDNYVLAYTWSEDSVEWELVEGRTLTAMDGSYTLTDQGDLTGVEYALAVDLAIPMPGMLKRKAQKTIIDGALKGLKRRVEG